MVDERFSVARSDGAVVAWVALVVAAVALALAWVAYNRTGIDLQATVREAALSAAEQAQLTAARLQARTRLSALRAAAAARQASPEAAAQVQQVRVGLQQAYDTASATAQAQWQRLGPELERLEAQLRDGSADAAATLAGLLTELARDVRTGG